MDKANTVAFDVAYYSEATGTKVFSHSYHEEWEKLDIHCPACAEKSVWRNSGPGDYYIEAQHICEACGVEFYLPGGIEACRTEQDKQRLHTLRSSI